MLPVPRPGPRWPAEPWPPCPGKLCLRLAARSLLCHPHVWQGSAVTYKNHLCTFQLTVPSERQSKIELKCVNLVS